MDRLRGFLRHAPSLPTLLILFIILIWVTKLQSEGPVEQVPYSQFKDYIRDGRVKDVELSQDTIRGVAATTADAPPVAPPTSRWRTGAPRGLVYQAIRIPNDETLIPLLDEKAMTYKAVPDDDWFGPLLWGIMPLILLVVLWGFVMRRMGAGGQGPQVMTFGKSRAKIYAEEGTGVTFADVAGVDEAKEELEEFIAFLKTPEKFQRLGGRIPKGVLLVGPPGTGKTLLARAVAGEAGVPFFSLSGSDFVEMFVGVGASRVRDLFEQAVKRAPCIVFIDELDAIGKARGAGGMMGGNDERDQTLNQLLVEMDGFDARKGVIIMAATNRPEVLDTALTRAGRFDRQVIVNRPDLKEREAILRVHVKKVRLGPGVELHVLAQRTPGFAGAELSNIVNEAALLAARRDLEAVGMPEFEEAIERVVAGLSKKRGILNAREKNIVAYHESGHTLMAFNARTADPVAKVSIIPRGMGALGYTLQMPLEDRYLMTRLELLDRIAVLLGGRVAEEIIFGDVSTGAQDDLNRATEIARRMVKEYGMSKTLGPRTFVEGRRSFMGNDSGVFGERDHSEQTQEAIDAEVGQILEERYRLVLDTLTLKRDVLERLAKRLLETEVIDREELEKMLGPRLGDSTLAEKRRVDDAARALTESATAQA